MVIGPLISGKNNSPSDNQAVSPSTGGVIQPLLSHSLVGNQSSSKPAPFTLIPQGGQSNQPQQQQTQTPQQNSNPLSGLLSDIGNVFNNVTSNIETGADVAGKAIENVLIKNNIISPEQTSSIINYVQNGLDSAKTDLSSAARELTTEGLVPSAEGPVAPEKEYMSQQEYNTAVKNNQTPTLGQQVNLALGQNVALAPIMMVGGWAVDPVTEGIAKLVPKGTSIISDLLSVMAKGGIKSAPYGLATAALPAQNNQQRIESTAGNVAAYTLLGMGLAGAGRIGGELVNKFGEDAVGFLANRDLIYKVVTGNANKEELSQFNVLNDTGLKAEVARTPGDTSIQTGTVQKQGKMWTILRWMFNDHFQPETQQGGAIPPLLQKGADVAPQETNTANPIETQNPAETSVAGSAPQESHNTEDLPINSQEPKPAVTQNPTEETATPPVVSQPAVRVPTEFKSPTEEKAFTQITSDPTKITSQYIEKFGNEVNPDLALQLFDSYKGHNSGQLSRVSGAVKSLVYNKLLETEQGKKNNSVFIAAGGSGSGKTSAVNADAPLKKNYSIVLDTTFSHNSAVEDVKKALKSGYNVDVGYVLRHPQEAWKNGVLPRTNSEGRVISEGYFLKSHIDARRNILSLYDKYKDDKRVGFITYENTPEGIKKSDIDTVRSMSYNKPALAEYIKNSTDEAYEQGRITKAQYKATTTDRRDLERYAAQSERGTKQSLRKTTEPTYTPEVGEAIDLVRDALYSGDEKAAQSLHDAFSQEYKDFPQFEALQDDNEKLYLDNMVQLATIKKELVEEGISSNPDDPNNQLYQIAQKLADHFSRPRAKYKITGSERTYVSKDGKTFLAGGSASQAFDRLINATDIEGFKKNIQVLHEKFDKVFTEIYDKIRRGAIDDGNYQTFRTYYQSIQGQRFNKFSVNGKVVQDTGDKTDNESIQNATSGATVQRSPNANGETNQNPESSNAVNLNAENTEDSNNEPRELASTENAGTVGTSNRSNESERSINNEHQTSNASGSEVEASRIPGKPNTIEEPQRPTAPTTSTPATSKEFIPSESEEEDEPEGVKIAPGLDQFINEDVLPKTSGIIPWIKDLNHEIKAVISPVSLADDKALNLVFTYKGENDLFRFLNREKYKNYTLLGKQVNLMHYWDKFPKEYTHAFYHNFEHALGQPIPEWEHLDTMYRQRYDDIYDALSKYKNIQKIDNYFKRLWEQNGNTEKSFNEYNRKRGLQGDTSWTKKRFYKFYMDAVEAGKIAKITNPETVTQIAEENANRFVNAQIMWKAAKEAGKRTYVPLGKQPPIGFAQIDDKIAQVYLPPPKISEYFDQEMWDKLHNFGNSLGIKNDRRMKTGGSRLGYTSPKMDSIVTKFGSPTGVIAHELGHQLDWKYDLKDRFLQQPRFRTELRALADKRYEGQEASKAFQNYVRKGSEKMANMIDAYIHAPELFKQTAPNVYKALSKFINSKPELRPLNDIKPSLIIGENQGTINAGGPIMGGHWWAEENFARLVNRHLSPDKFSHSITGRALQSQKALLNGFELSFSAFHPTFLGIDSLSNKLSLIGRQMASGNFKALPRTFGTTPVALIDYYMQGNSIIKKALAGDPESYAALKAAATAGDKIKAPDGIEATVLDNFMRNIRSGNIIGAIFRSPYALIEGTMHPLFENVIPRAKLGVFWENYAQALIENADRITAGQVDKQTLARTIWRDVEDRMGELNYENLFWNNTFKGSVQVAMRAPGWFKGTMGTFGGGSKDNAQFIGDLTKYIFMKGDTPQFSQRGQYLWSMIFATMAIGGTYQYLHTRKWPSNLEDYFMPKNGAVDANGNDIRIVLPTYFKDAISMLNNPLRYVENKTAPEINLLWEALNNQDFFGNYIRNLNDPAAEQVMQTVGFLLNSGLSPFSYQQSAQQPTLTSKLESLSGIMKAPSQFIESAQQKAAQQAYDNQMGAQGPQTPEQQATAQLKAQARNQIKQSGWQSSSAFQQLMQNGTLKTQRQRTDFIKSATQTGTQRLIKHLPKATRTQILNMSNSQPSLANKQSTQPLLPQVQGVTAPNTRIQLQGQPNIITPDNNYRQVNQQETSGNAAAKRTNLTVSSQNVNSMETLTPQQANLRYQENSNGKIAKPLKEVGNLETGTT